MSSEGRVEDRGERSSITAALEVLRRRWPIVLATVLVCTAVSAIQEKRSSKTYKATAAVTFQSGTPGEAALGVGSSSSVEPQREADTQVTIAHSPEVAKLVGKQLGSPLSPEALLDLVTVEAAPNADVLDITASTGDARGSATLANAFANQYINFRANSQLSSIDTAKEQLQTQLATLPPGSAEAATVKADIQRLGLQRAVVGGGANIIGRATPPSSPSGMRLSTAIIIGLLVGLALAFTLVLVLESLDRSVKSTEEFEREYRLPALTVVPESAMRPSRAAERSELLEPYRILRSALEFAAITRQLDTLLVTSAVPGEGKTTVSIDLAHAIALTKRRVVLLELDLRKPTFARHFQLDPRRGLTTALLRGKPASELLVEPFPELPNFSILPAGRLPQNPSELLASPVVPEIISEVGGEDTTVIIDAPPLNPVADTQVLLNSSAIEATLLVARINKTTREQTRRARTILDRHMIEAIGLVITGARDGGRYSYAYSYTSRRDEAETVTVDPQDAARRAAEKRLSL